ncbi:MAG TPA: two-component regulator propeller domain-containing protein, partial [Bacteroidia bacterium]|nr:two-component regulator propeller domain-containing protein [Bacteroidia bacterium]
MKNRSIILFLLLCNALVAQQFNFSNIGTDRGLPSSEVYYVLQDHKGYMWFATTYGVCRYNGKRFTTYTTAQGLTDN